MKRREENCCGGEFVYNISTHCSYFSVPTTSDRILIDPSSSGDSSSIPVSVFPFPLLYVLHHFKNTSLGLGSSIGWFIFNFNGSDLKSLERWNAICLWLFFREPSSLRSVSFICAFGHFRLKHFSFVSCGFLSFFFPQILRSGFILGNGKRWSVQAVSWCKIWMSSLWYSFWTSFSVSKLKWKVFDNEGLCVFFQI